MLLEILLGKVPPRPPDPVHRDFDWWRPVSGTLVFEMFLRRKTTLEGLTEKPSGRNTLWLVRSRDFYERELCGPSVTNGSTSRCAEGPAMSFAAT